MVALLRRRRSPILEPALEVTARAPALDAGTVARRCGAVGADAIASSTMHTEAFAVMR
jgi:hypothetical protein